MVSPLENPNYGSTGSQPQIGIPLRILEGTARVISGDYKIKLVESTQGRWYYRFDTHEIGFLANDLAHSDEDIPLAFMMHEVSHALNSDLTVVDDDLKENTAFHTLLNAIEDVRVNEIIMRTHPGSGPQIRKLYRSKYVVSEEEFEDAAQRMQSYPLHLQFGYGLLYEWFMQETDPRISDMRVLALLKECQPDIILAYQSPSARESYEIIHERIWSKFQSLVEEAWNTAVEQELIRSAGNKLRGTPSEQPEKLDSETLKRNRSWKERQPEDGSVPQESSAGLEDQIQRDVEKLIQQAEQEFNEQLRGRMLPDPLNNDASPEESAYADQFENGKRQLAQAEHKSRRKDEILDENRLASERAQTLLHTWKLGKEGITEEQEAIYKSYHDPVRLYIASLAHQLRIAFKDVTHQRLVTNLTTGELSQSSLAIIPTGSDRLFERKLIPKKFEYIISILVDESDSMRDDDRYKRAIEGVVMLQEALEQIGGVAYEIVGFNANPHIPHKTFEDRLTKKKAVEIVQSIERNVGGTTADTEALEHAFERVRRRTGKHLIFLLTDGNPNRPSDRTDLDRVIRKARKTRVFALGIGGSTLVERVYPTGLSVGGLDEVPGKLAAILKHELRK